MEGKFEVLDEVNRQYRRFKAQGTQLKVRLLHPPDDDGGDNKVIIDPITHFESCVYALFEFTLKISKTDMVGIVIQNENMRKTLRKINP
jgi:hypothetical protein